MLTITNCAKMSPKDIGKEIANRYHIAITKLNSITNNYPEANDFKNDLKRLKAESIRIMIDLGQRRNDLNQRDRNLSDIFMVLALSKIQKNSDMQAMNKAIKYYKTKNKQIFKLITSFKKITHFASFEILKRSQPKQARLHGIR